MGADLCVCFNLDAVLLDQSRVVDVDDAVAVDVGCNCLNVVKRQQLCRFQLNMTSTSMPVVYFSGRS